MSIKRVTQGQGSLFPPHLGDLVPEDHPVRLIDEVVSKVSVQEFVDDYGVEGSPGYPPGLMLKILIYAYSTGLRSTRRIAEATRHNNLFRWLASEQTPDYRTFAYFQKRHRERIVGYFAEVTRLLVEIGRVDLANWSVDGTRIRAAASASSLVPPEKFKQEVVDRAEADVLEIMKAIAERDDAEDREPDPDNDRALKGDLAKREARAALIDAAYARLQASTSKKPRASKTEPETTVVSPGEIGAGPGYNAQLVVDASSKFILACEVVADPTDNAHLIPLLDAAIANTGESPEYVTADSGYTSGATLEALDSRGIAALIPQTGEDSRRDEKARVTHPATGLLLEVDHQSHIRWTEFAASADPDGKPTRTCPADRVLRQVGRRVRTRKSGTSSYTLFKSSDCRGCGLASLCLSPPHRATGLVPPDERPPRSVQVPDHECLIRENSARLRSEDGSKRYRERMTSIEPKNADLKRYGGLRRLSTWGLRAARATLALTCIATNVKRLAKMGVKEAVADIRRISR